MSVDLRLSLRGLEAGERQRDVECVIRRSFEPDQRGISRWKHHNPGIEMYVKEETKAEGAEAVVRHP